MTEIAGHNGNEPWISLESASWWFDKSSVVLALSLFVGFLCTVVIIVTGIAKEHHWDIARDEAREKIASLELETAKANVRTKEAELKLAEVREKLGRPRKLNDQRFIDRLASAQKLPVMVSSASEDPDSHWLSFSIAGALRRAGWEEGWAPQTDPNVKLCAGPFGGIFVLARSMPTEIDSHEAFQRLLQNRHSTSIPMVAIADALNGALGDEENSARFATCPFVEEGKLHIVVTPRWVILPLDQSPTPAEAANPVQNAK